MLISTALNSAPSYQVIARYYLGGFSPVDAAVCNWVRQRMAAIRAEEAAATVTPIEAVRDNQYAKVA